ncbi:MAG: hypothetical protein Q9210_002609 [Variospora velana]
MHSTRVLTLFRMLPIVRPKPGETVKPIRTKARSATILPNFIGLKFQVHNGKIYHDVTITEDMDEKDLYLQAKQEQMIPNKRPTQESIVAQFLLFTTPADIGSEHLTRWTLQLLLFAALFEATKIGLCRKASVAGETKTFDTGLVDKQLASLDRPFRITFIMPATPNSELLTLKTIYGETTLEEALLEEHNMLHKLKYWQKREDLLRYLEDHINDIEATVSYLLALDKTKQCRVERVGLWRHGSFNKCIPIRVTDRGGQQRERFIIRFPLPYKIGEDTFPGNADEKLRCEAATYIWIGQNCPDVPIPRLLGFSFDGMQLKYGFLLISYIERHDGVMLLETWEDQQHDKAKRTNLFRGLSQIMLSLSRIPLPRIGSFTLDDQGVISLTNRPLTLRLHELENEGVPTGIARSDTYTSIEPYALDLLGYHESLLRYRPNTINSKLDCEAQMAVQPGMRAVLPHFIERGLRNGPFQLTLTDFSRANMYVDKDWHIKSIFDLEWACSLPVQMQNSPCWLTNRGVDQLQGDDFTAYKDMHDEFMEAFEKEERLQHTGLPEGVNAPHTRVMRRSWDSGGFFYFHALDTTVGLFNLFWQHIWPRFSHPSKEPEKAFEETVFPFWSFDAQSVAAAKLKDREEYEADLRALFEAQGGKARSTIHRSSNGK